jgi:hypothetical protein
LPETDKEPEEGPCEPHGQVPEHVTLAFIGRKNLPGAQSLTQSISFLPPALYVLVFAGHIAHLEVPSPK